MVTVDLITGFLGAGKTTFILRYLHFLQKQGLRVKMIENEFGDVSIDSQLLTEEHCDIADLTGLCMCCVGKDAFIRLLQESAASGCDRILVEPSGIYDVDEFFEVLSLPQISSLCEIGSIITIADPQGMEYLTEEARYLLFAQLLASGIVLLSKSQEMSPAAITEAKEALDQLMKERGCECGLPADLCTKPWNQLSEFDFEDIMDAGYCRVVHDRELFSHSEAFGSTAIIGHCRDEADLRDRIGRLFDSPSCGRVYRIKGYVKGDNEILYEINCTISTWSVKEVTSGEEVLVVIGQQLREREIRDIWRKN
ncbi:MAG: hypothetical protein MJ117_06220 [Lachnospiraceae bacterium]|nr:hypothetical protein [Lachnospiraceae bacterium]